MRLGLLDGYKTLSDFRKTDHNQYYYDQLKWIIPKLEEANLAIQKLKVFHGDHKANNVMVDFQNQDLRILDFGKSKTYSEVEQQCAQCQQEFMKADLTRRLYLISHRKMCFFQNLYYSSILQYVYNEYQHKNYAKLLGMIDNHSIGLLMCHMYFETYINDFEKSNTTDGRRQQFFGQYINLFGLDNLLQLVLLSNRYCLQNNEFDPDVEFNSYSDTDESEFSEVCELDAELQIPYDLSLGFKIRDDVLKVSPRVQKEMDEHAIDIGQVLAQIPAAERRVVGRMLSDAQVEELLRGQ